MAKIIDPATLATIMTLLVAWFTFRSANKKIRDSFLVSLGKELEWVGEWLNKKYFFELPLSEQSNTYKSWYGILVYIFEITANHGIQGAIASPYASYISKELIESLISLSVGISRFNQHVQRYENCISSNASLAYRASEIITELGLNNDSKSFAEIKDALSKRKEDKKEDKEVEVVNFIGLLYSIKESAHMSGIGIGTKQEYYNNDKRFPIPRIAMKNALELLEQEKKKKFWDWKDLMVLVISLFVLYLSVIYLPK
ncbi:hypothetical protein HYV44_00205 [Candidatus Microgenomates bacterium]|nr:hypothetical protein [Candidatus Microgenomates bacterium]